MPTVRQKNKEIARRILLCELKEMTMSKIYHLFIKRSKSEGLALLRGGTRQYRDFLGKSNRNHLGSGFPFGVNSLSRFFKENCQMF